MLFFFGAFVHYLGVVVHKKIAFNTQKSVFDTQIFFYFNYNKINLNYKI